MQSVRSYQPVACTGLDHLLTHRYPSALIQAMLLPSSGSRSHKFSEATHGQADQASAVRGRKREDSTTYLEMVDEPTIAVPGRRQGAILRCCLASQPYLTRRPSASRSSSPSYPDESTVTESLAPGSSDELKSEADRAATLFIRSGGAQQLNLDESVRERVLADLARSTHPDVFLPAYEEASVMLETNSLGAFLRHPIEVSPAKRQLWCAPFDVNVMSSSN